MSRNNKAHNVTDYKASVGESIFDSGGQNTTNSC